MAVMRVSVMVVMAGVVMATRREEVEQVLKNQLARDLGMASAGMRGNVSWPEYERMREVWREAERQAEVVRMVRKGWKRMGGDYRENLVARVEERVGEQGETRVRVTFPVEQLGRRVLVKEALLRATVEEDGGSAERRIVQIVAGEEGITLVSTLQEEIEVGEVVQGWLEKLDSNLGLLLLLPPGTKLLGLPSLSLLLQKGRHGRSRRSAMMHSNDCSSRRDGRCCREDMEVDLAKLKGFEFIFEPRQFNAFMCAGRCPARFLPMNDHSLLQSLLHLQQGEEDATAPRVKRPCCVPSQYESMNILHLDPEDSSKLRVTSWKSVIVTQCACG